MPGPQDGWWLTPDEIGALLRLLAAVGCGMVIGINRDLHGKPTGMRTLGLVGLGAALISLSAMRVDGVAGHPDATSRAVQGIVQGVMTGIGFLGAGVVLHDRHGQSVHGLTTAATVWVTAALGVACAIAPWHLILTALAVTVVLLALLLPLDRRLDAEGDPPPRKAPAADTAAGEEPRPPSR